MNVFYIIFWAILLFLVLLCISLQQEILRILRFLAIQSVAMLCKDMQYDADLVNEAIKKSVDIFNENAMKVLGK